MGVKILAKRIPSFLAFFLFFLFFSSIFFLFRAEGAEGICVGILQALNR